MVSRDMVRDIGLFRAPAMSAPDKKSDKKRGLFILL